jgi:hypothetical protein
MRGWQLGHELGELVTVQKMGAGQKTNGGKLRTVVDIAKST